MNDYRGEDDWQEARRADELVIERQIEEALVASRARPLSDDEIHLLAWASGVQLH